jgi:hypothetical protein
MPTKEEKKRKAQRLLEMEAGLSIGMSSRAIQLRFSVEYGVSERQIRKDVLAIQSKWSAEAEAEGRGDLRRNQTRQLLKTIAMKALAAGKFTAAVQAANRLMELDGLKVLKIEHSGKVEHGISEMTSADKRSRLAELLSLAQQKSQLEAKKKEFAKEARAKKKMDASKVTIEERANARKESRKN